MNKIVFWESTTWLSFGISLTLLNDVLQAVALIVAIISGVITIIVSFRKRK